MAFSKTYLQTMSTDELLELADKYGLFLSPDMTRRLLIGELLDVDDEFIDERHMLENTEFGCSHSCYITEIHIVLKNPLWFFVFWDFNETTLSTIMESRDFSHFFIRIYSLDSYSVDCKQYDFYDVEVSATDRNRYIHISFDECRHRVDLMACFSDKREQLLAQSNMIQISRGVIAQRLCIAQNAVDRVTDLSGLKSLKTSHFQHYGRAFR